MSIVKSEPICNKTSTIQTKCAISSTYFEILELSLIFQWKGCGSNVSVITDFVPVTQLFYMTISAVHWNSNRNHAALVLMFFYCFCKAIFLFPARFKVSYRKRGRLRSPDGYKCATVLEASIFVRVVSVPERNLLPGDHFLAGIWPS